MYCLINVALIGLSLFLMRRVYAVFGAHGRRPLYLGHLAAKVFADSLLFPFALSLIGVGIIACRPLPASASPEALGVDGGAAA